MTDNEIIKALECCANETGSCLGCPLINCIEDCLQIKSKNALDLINCQKAEIERLNKDCEDVIYKLEYLLCHATGNKFSKHTYPIGDMVSYVNDYIQDCCNEAVEEAKETVKSEAIKEFAERLKDEMRLEDDCRYDCMNCLYECKGYVPIIDNLVKEMIEVEE